MAIRTTRATTVASSEITAPCSERGTSVPSLRYARSAKASSTVGNPARRGVAQQRGVGKCKHGQRVVEGVRGLDDGRRLRVIPDRAVVERAVRLEIRHGAASSDGAGLQRAQLVEHVGRQVVRGDVDVATTESDQIAVADLRTDPHARARLRRSQMRRMIVGSPA